MGLLDFLKAKVNNSKVDMSKRYAFLRAAVSGTMSKFYKAKDLRTGQVVGLKILDREKSAAFEERFRNMNKPSEGEVGMLLKHPLLVETLEHGTTTEGVQYVAMEYIDGPDFNSLIIGKDPVLDGNRAHFIRQAAEAHRGGPQGRLYPSRHLATKLPPRRPRKEAAQADRLSASRCPPSRSFSNRAFARAIRTTWPRRSSAASRPTSGSMSSRSARRRI